MRPRPDPPQVPFAVELVIRFIVCPNRPVFWFDVYNLMDFLAIFASFLPRLIAILVLNSEGELAYACQIFSPFLFMLRLLLRAACVCWPSSGIALHGEPPEGAALWRFSRWCC